MIDPPSPRTAPTAFSLHRAVAAFMLSRFAQDSASRAPLPFLGVIAAAYGQDIGAVSWLSIALTLAGLVSPLASILSHRFGSRRLLLWPPLVFVIACALLPFAPSFASVIALFIAISLTKAMFDPQVQTFIAERVPFERRGTVIGVLELSWALSFLIGAPVFGLLVDRVSWSAPFVLMGSIALLGMVAVWFYVRPAMPGADVKASFSLEPWRTVWRNPRARSFWAFSVGIMIAAQMPFLVYPTWMKVHFQLSNGQLGLVSTVIGVADVIAELLVIAFLDRIGKRRAVLIAGGFYALAFSLFWALSASLLGMMIALFSIYLAFEFTLVASLPIASETVPESRAAMMGWNAASIATGRIIGSLIAWPLFGSDRLWLVALVGCVAVSSSLVFMAISTRHALRSGAG